MDWKITFLSLIPAILIVILPHMITLVKNLKIIKQYNLQEESERVVRWGALRLKDWVEEELDKLRKQKNGELTDEEKKEARNTAREKAKEFVKKNLPSGANTDDDVVIARIEEELNKKS